jgi:hypothetical protein
MTHHHVWDADLVATVGDLEIELEAVFGPINVPVLGRRDFFSRFRVEFDERDRVTYLTPYQRAGFVTGGRNPRRA